MKQPNAMFIPLHNPPFRRVWLGQFVSVTGDAAFVVALAGVLVRGADPAKTLSLAVAVLSAGSIFSVLVGGVLADRFRRSRLIITSDVLRMLGCALVVMSSSGERLGALISGVVLIGVGEGLHQPVYQALYPTLVPNEERQAANALRSLSNRAASIIGAALAAALIAFGGTELAIFINGGTYLISIATLIALRDASPQRSRQDDLAETFFHEATAGLKYVWQRKWMLAVMLSGMAQVAFITTPLGVVLPIALRDRPEVFGLVMASQAGGAVVGSMLGARAAFQRRGLVAVLAASTEGLAMVAVAAGAPAILICAAGVIGGAGLALFAVIWVTALQDEVPEHLRGRVFSIDLLTAIGFAPAASVVAGFAVGSFGAVTTAWGASVGLVVTTAICLAVPGVRLFKDPSTRRGREESFVR